MEFIWTGECHTAFDTLKERLTLAPILALPTDEGTYLLDTDASDYGLGAILSQKQDGIERVIAYASRTMTKSEFNYETTKKEILAVFGLKQFRQYLPRRDFVIRTEHAALTWPRKSPEPMPEVARWLTLIEQYDYEVVHQRGKQHANADELSCRPTISPATDDQQVQITRVQTKPEMQSEQALALNNNLYLTIWLSQSTRSSAPTNRFHPKVRNVDPEREVVHLMVRDNLADNQRTDAELGRVVQLRWETDEQPANESIQTDSELT